MRAGDFIKTKKKSSLWGYGVVLSMKPFQFKMFFSYWGYWEGVYNPKDFVVIDIDEFVTEYYKQAIAKAYRRDCENE